MVHIAEDRRTTENLKYWSQGKELILLSYFFWRPGNELQNNTNGLLRTILHQICTDSPTAKAGVLDFVGESQRKWTDRRLVEAIVKALSEASEMFCLFVDGLDEYTGDHNELVELILQLERPDNVKACVSSRPESTFVDRLSKYKRLCLEDLNRSDLTNFVTAKLGPHKIDDRRLLIREIVQRASGMFLWAALETKSLVEGLQKGDTSEMLDARLKEMPDELDDLFSAMAKGIEERYKKWLGFYINLMQLRMRYRPPDSTGLFDSIAYITASLLPKSPRSYGTFAKACKGIEAPVPFRSAGLLEVPRHGGFRMPELQQEWQDARCRFAIPRLLYSTQSDLTTSSWSPNDLAVEKRPIGAESALSECSFYDHLNLEWIHRSAYDFVMTRNDSSWLKCEQNEATVLESLFTGMVRYLAIAPSWLGDVDSDGDLNTSDTRLSHLFSCAGEVYADYPALVLSFLDRLYDVVVRLEPEEFDLREPLLQAYRPALTASVGAIAFWVKGFSLFDCAERLGSLEKMYIDYVTIRSDRWVRDTDGGYFIRPLDCLVLSLFAKHASSMGPPSSNVDDSESEPAAPDLGESHSNEVGSSDSQMSEPDLDETFSDGSHLRSFEDFAVALLQRMHHTVTSKKPSVRVRRHFIYADIGFFGGVIVEAALMSGLESMSCDWPEHTDPSETSMGHAIAIFMLVTVFRESLVSANDTTEACQMYGEIMEALHSLIDAFNPAWNVELSFGLPRRPPRCLSMELSHNLWKALIQRGRGEAQPDDSIWQNPPIRFVCFPHSGENAVQNPSSSFWEARDFCYRDYMYWDSKAPAHSTGDSGDEDLNPVNAELASEHVTTSLHSHKFDHRTTRIDIEPRVATKVSLMGLLLSCPFEGYQAPYWHLRLHFGQWYHFHAVSLSLKQDVLDERQGLNEAKKTAALDCLQKEISSLEKLRPGTPGEAHHSKRH